MRRMFQKWMRRLPTTQIASRAKIHAGDGPGIVYQSWGLHGSALAYIDEGFRNAFRAENRRWAEWDPNDSGDSLCSTIERVRPSLLLLNLQTIQRRASDWCRPQIVERLLKLKSEIGFQVACRSHPSNLSDLFGPGCGIDFSEFCENVRSFYRQAEHPDADERVAIESGLIDLIRSAFFCGTYASGFRNYLERGLRILEEPHAADLVLYGQDEPRITDADGAGPDVLFVGGCWPFKWKNMRPYVEAMRKRFGNQFAVFGRGWPDGWSQGILPAEKFNTTLRAAKLNLTLHELSQTLPEPISGNERVFKLGALGCPCLSDANPLIKYHFNVESTVAWSSDPEAMVEMTESLLADPEERWRRARSTHWNVEQIHSYQYRIRRIESALQGTEAVEDFRGPECPAEWRIEASDSTSREAA